MRMKRFMQAVLVASLAFLGSSPSWAGAAAVSSGVAAASGGGAVAAGSGVAAASSGGGGAVAAGVGASVAASESHDCCCCCGGGGAAAVAAGVALAVYASVRTVSSHAAGERYRTEAVGLGDISQTVSATGTLNPVVLVRVGTQVSGTVSKLHADFNDRVHAGEVLVELDDALF